MALEIEDDILEEFRREFGHTVWFQRAEEDMKDRKTIPKRKRVGNFLIRRERIMQALNEMLHENNYTGRACEEIRETFDKHLVSMFESVQGEKQLAHRWRPRG